MARIFILFAIIAGLAAGFYSFIKYEQGIGAARCQAAWDTEKQAALVIASDERARQFSAQAEVVKLAQISHDKLVADVNAARDAASRLRERYAAIASYSVTSSASSPGASAPGSEGVLTDVFGQVIELARQYAKIADERGIAGQTCQQSYEKLTK